MGIALACAGLPAGASTQGATATNDLETEIAALNRALELADGDAYYLLLRLEPLTLTLMLEGVALREYPVRAWRLGRPRVLFRPIQVDAGWTERVWTDGHLDPTRRRPQIKINPPKPVSASASGVQPSDSGGSPPKPTEEPPLSVLIPPRVEEIVRVPPTYRIEFDGLILTVETVKDESSKPPSPTLWDRLRGARHFVEDRFAPLTPGTARLKLMMQAADAAHLYRALPADVGFAVVDLE